MTSTGHLEAKRRGRSDAILWLPCILVTLHETTQLAIVIYGLATNITEATLDTGLIHFLIELQGLLPVPFLAYFGLQAVPQLRVHTFNRVDLCLMALVPVSLLSFAVGLLSGNSTYYLLGDLYQLLALPAAYFPFILLAPREHVHIAIKRFFVALSLLSIGWLIIELYCVASYHRVFLFSTGTYLAPLMLLLNAKSRLSGKRVVWGTILLLGLLLTFKRIIYLGTPAIVLFVAILRGQRNALLARMIALLIIAVPLVIATSIAIDFDMWAFANDRLSSLFAVDDYSTPLDQSAQGRWYEAEGVLSAFWREPEPALSLVTGFGLGAMVDSPMEGQKHTIHLTWFAFLFRTGLIGMAVGLLWIFGFTFHVIRRGRQLRAVIPGAYWALVGLLLFIVLSSFLSSYIIWKDFYLAAITGLLCVSAQNAAATVTVTSSGADSLRQSCGKAPTSQLLT